MRNRFSAFIKLPLPAKSASSSIPSLETLYPLLVDAGDLLYEQGCLDAFVSLGDTLLVALDGTDLFSSAKISCPCCFDNWQHLMQFMLHGVVRLPVETSGFRLGIAAISFRIFYNTGLVC